MSIDGVGRPGFGFDGWVYAAILTVGYNDYDFEPGFMYRIEESHMTNTKIKIASASIVLLFSLPLISPSGGTENQPNSASNDTQINGKVVYVCTCLKTRSCSCMTEAKMEGPCACGTAGGPPLKPVAQDSAWAKANREALAH